MHISVYILCIIHKKCISKSQSPYGVEREEGARDEEERPDVKHHAPTYFSLGPWNYWLCSLARRIIISVKNKELINGKRTGRRLWRYITGKNDDTRDGARSVSRRAKGGVIVFYFLPFFFFTFFRRFHRLGREPIRRDRPIVRACARSWLWRELRRRIFSPLPRLLLLGFQTLLCVPFFRLPPSFFLFVFREERDSSIAPSAPPAMTHRVGSPAKLHQITKT